MADDKRKRGPRDRARVAKGQAYEVSYFMRKHGVTREQAERIIAQTGGSRDKANELAAQVSAAARPAHKQKRARSREGTGQTTLMTMEADRPCRSQFKALAEGRLDHLDSRSRSASPQGRMRWLHAQPATAQASAASVKELARSRTQTLILIALCAAGPGNAPRVAGPAYSVTVSMKTLPSAVVKQIGEIRH